MTARIREIWEEANETHRQELFREMNKTSVPVAGFFGAVVTLIVLGNGSPNVTGLALLGGMGTLVGWALWFRPPSRRVLLVLRLAEVAMVAQSLTSAPGKAVRKR